MKILFDNRTPYSFAHGGAQVQIERTKAALQEIGVEVEYLEWWNSRQTGDVLHQVGFVSLPVIRLAARKGLKVVMTLLLTATCNRSRRELALRRLCIRSALAAPIPKAVKDRLPWMVYHACDQVVVGLEAERRVLVEVYGLKKEQVSVVPLGMGETYLKAGPPLRTEEHLICTGTIGPLKSSLELARLALEARVPILFVGKPHGVNTPYWREFEGLKDDKFVKYHPQVGTEAGLVDLLRRARGYVLMSRSENWSLAAHEAAACGVPMLVPDQPWSRERFGGQARFFPRKAVGAARALREFYDACPSIPSPRVRLYSWIEVAEMLREVYQKVGGSR